MLRNIASSLRVLLMVTVICALAITSASASLWNKIPPQDTNLALTGTASSSGGWGGGWNTFSINDGLREYNSWANGLAFQYGDGLRWAIIDFGVVTSFNEVVMWQHGGNYTPANTALDYWDGSDWAPITINERLYDLDQTACHVDGQGSGYSNCDIYLFDSVQANAVRYSFYNSQKAVTGESLIHGWIYEFEVYQTPEPASLLLMGTGALGILAAIRRKRSR